MNFKEGDVFTVPWRLTINATPEEMRAYTCGAKEGRREVLREIAAMQPKYFGGADGCDAYCRFCDNDLDYPDQSHRRSCLWLRAQEATK